MNRKFLVGCLAAVLALLVTGVMAQPAGAAESLVTLRVDPVTVATGQAVSLTGAVTSPAPPTGTAVLIERRTDSGWAPLTSLSTAADGSFSGSLTPDTGMSIRANLEGKGATSEVVSMNVTPVVRAPARITSGYLVGSDVTWRVAPADYAGAVHVVDRSGRVLGSGQASSGSVRLHISSQRLGAVPATVRAGASGGLSATSQQITVVTVAPRLAPGNRGPIVKALLLKLKSLRYHTPALTSRYSKRVSDVVLAFQKVKRLKRTAIMNQKTWRALSVSGPVRARVKGRGTHIEVDKARQVLLLVRNGSVLGTLHVSTGLTGNTPVGRFRVYSKAPNSLFRFMPFLRGFGIHGYVPVPPYPASHGCVREPMWAANWTYQHSRVGTPVIIYN